MHHIANKMKIILIIMELKMHYVENEIMNISHQKEYLLFKWIKKIN